MCRAPIEIVVICLQWATGKIEQVVGIFVTPARGLKFWFLNFKNLFFDFATVLQNHLFGNYQNRLEKMELNFIF